MIRALWFMVKVGLVVALAVWVAERPGTVKIQWLDYTFTIHVGFFLLVLMGSILLSIFVYQVIRTFVDFPRSYRRYLERRRTEKGRRALTLGLTAVAAGDAKTAVYQAQRTTKLLPDDRGLPLLLAAQAARLDGREADAQKYFVALLENKDAAFLGVRGLLQAALDSGDHTHALALAEQALKLHPKQRWILRVVYDLEIGQRRWQQARAILYRAEKAGAIDAAKATADRTAILMAEAEDDIRADKREAALAKVFKALKHDPHFVPALAQAARLCNQTGRRRRAVSLVEKAWKQAPHPEYIAVWDALAPTGQVKKPLARLQWFERLLAANPDSAEAQIHAGRLAMEQGLWGEARAHFNRAEQIAPGEALYRALADLEEKSSRNTDAALAWHEKADTAPPSKAWICAATGRTYDHWQALATPHGAFNTIHWDFPQGSDLSALRGPAGTPMADAMLEAAPRSGAAAAKA